jgi:hypothetical protein
MATIRHKLPPAADIIAEMEADDVNQSSIAARYGVTRAAVSAALKAAGLVVAPKPPGRTVALAPLHVPEEMAEWLAANVKKQKRNNFIVGLIRQAMDKTT